MGGEGGTFPLLGVTPVGGTSEMEAFWGRWGTRGTLGAPLEALLERGADLGCFFRAFWEALGDLGVLGDPTLTIFPSRGRHCAAPGRHPSHHAVETCVLAASRCQKVRFSQGADSSYI